MSIAEKTRSSVGKAIAYLRLTQDGQGRWLGAQRSTNLIHYAIGLALAGEPPQSPIIQDICDCLECWSTSQGGFGDYPGEPARAYATSLISPLLVWARPASPTLARAIQYLNCTGQRYRDPTVALSRYVFDQASRQELLADKGPPLWLRHLVLGLGKRHPTERWDISSLYPGYYRQPGLRQRLLEPFLLRAVTFPPWDSLDQAAAQAASPTGFDQMLLISAALRRLAGDTTDGAVRLQQFALQRRKRFIFDDGSYEWIAPLVADLFFTTAFEMNRERERAIAEVRRIAYQGNGWINGDSVTVHIFDTSLTVLALRQAGLPERDEMIRNAVQYLKEARSAEHGMWSWAYSPGMGSRRPYLDTDDTGTVLMALHAAGEPAESGILSTAKNGLSKLQEASGAFSLFGDGVVRPNWCWLSNTTHSLLGLLAAGATPEDTQLRRGIAWVTSQRLADGSWVDGWCTRYIYGTVMALEALLKCGALVSREARVEQSIGWLLSRQNSDGGWGENWAGASCSSSAEHTGLALYGLSIASAVGGAPLDAICSGLRWLADNQKNDGSWQSTYFLDFGFGSGMADAQLPLVWALHGMGAGLRLLDANHTHVASSS